jgi:leader peptidase (prepilin peptidase) / N-methyltransferase
MLALAGGYPWLAALFGLLIGSFLNVVIHRLPKMMETGWKRELAEYAGQPDPTTDQLNLLTPASRCPACGHRIRWFENIPVLSFLFLKGKCSECGHGIGWRYPLVEVVTAALAWYCTQRFGLNWGALAWFGFCAALLCLALIDWDTTFLPDDITLPLLWAGLIVAALGLNPLVQDWQHALWGCVIGYLSLWSIYWVFKLATGKEGMGYGDFKLFAALGAWFGWHGLIPIILMASVVGVIVGLALKFSGRLREGGYVPFGPFLVAAGFLTLALGSDNILRVLQP